MSALMIIPDEAIEAAAKMFDRLRVVKDEWDAALLILQAAAPYLIPQEAVEERAKIADQSAKGAPMAVVLQINSDAYRAAETAFSAEPDSRKKLVAALQAAAPYLIREAVEWQPINTAPKDGTKFIALGSDKPDRHFVSITYWLTAKGPSGFTGWAWPYNPPPLQWTPIPEIERRN